MDRIILVVATVVVALSAVPDGSRSHLASTALATSIHVLFLLYVAMFFNQEKCNAVVRGFPWIWGSLGVWLLVALLQSFGLFGYENYDRSVTLFELNLYFAYVEFLFLMACLLDTYGKIRFVMGVILVAAVAQTWFGLYNFYLGQPPFGWKPPLHSGIRVSGSFINRNFYANFVLMSVGLTLIPVLLKRVTVGSQEKQAGVRYHGIVLTLCYLAVSVFLVSGMILSASRGALLAFGVALVMVLGLSVFSNRVRIGGGWLVTAIVLSLGLAGFDMAGSRFSALLGDSAGRLTQWKASLQLILDKWLVGYGPGSYETVYKTGIPFTASPLVHDHAHNDYIELLLEQGMIGSLPLFVAVSLIIHQGIKKLMTTRSYNKTVILLASLFGVVAMLMHAFVDYPFQVPANSLLFLLLVAIMLSSVRLPYRSRG